MVMASRSPVFMPGSTLRPTTSHATDSRRAPFTRQPHGARARSHPALDLPGRHAAGGADLLPGYRRSVGCRSAKNPGAHARTVGTALSHRHARHHTAAPAGDRKSVV